MSPTCPSKDALIICWHDFSESVVSDKHKYSSKLYYFPRYELLSRDRQTDKQTESDAYEPTMQYAQMGSITNHRWPRISRKREIIYQIFFCLQNEFWTLLQDNKINDKSKLGCKYFIFLFINYLKFLIKTNNIII